MEQHDRDMIIKQLSLLKVIGLIYQAIQGNFENVKEWENINDLVKVCVSTNRSIITLTKLKLEELEGE